MAGYEGGICRPLSRKITEHRSIRIEAGSIVCQLKQAVLFASKHEITVQHTTAYKEPRERRKESNTIIGRNRQASNGYADAGTFNISGLCVSQ